MKTRCCRCNPTSGPLRPCRRPRPVFPGTRRPIDLLPSVRASDRKGRGTEPGRGEGGGLFLRHRRSPPLPPVAAAVSVVVVAVSRPRSHRLRARPGFGDRTDRSTGEERGFRRRRHRRRLRPRSSSERSAVPGGRSVCRAR